MAVDTASKRFSVIGWLRGSVPLPDGTLSMNDRAQLLREYRLGTYGTGVDITATSFNRRSTTPGSRGGAYPAFRRR